jgi:hypothetical protein
VFRDVDVLNLATETNHGELHLMVVSQLLTTAFTAHDRSIREFSYLVSSELIDG